MCGGICGSSVAVALAAVVVVVVVAVMAVVAVAFVAEELGERRCRPTPMHRSASIRFLFVQRHLQ